MQQRESELEALALLLQQAVFFQGPCEAIYRRHREPRARRDLAWAKVNVPPRENAQDRHRLVEDADPGFHCLRHAHTSCSSKRVLILIDSTYWNQLHILDD